MKRFSSRYERIRHLRSQQEDACRAAAAARNAERAVAQQQWDTVQQWLDTIHRTAARDMANSHERRSFCVDDQHDAAWGTKTAGCR